MPIGQKRATKGQQGEKTQTWCLCSLPLRKPDTALAQDERSMLNAMQHFAIGIPRQARNDRHERTQQSRKRASP